MILQKRKSLFAVILTLGIQQHSVIVAKACLGFCKVEG